MISHDTLECHACHGSGRVIAKSRRGSRSSLCSCPAGRALAFTPAQSLALRMADLRQEGNKP